MDTRYLVTYPGGDGRLEVIKFGEIACLKRVDTCGCSGHRRGQGHLSRNKLDYQSSTEKEHDNEHR